MPPASGYIITAILPKITQRLVITAESIGKIPSIIKNRIVHFSSINSIYPTKININTKISLSLGRKEKEIMKKTRDGKRAFVGIGNDIEYDLSLPLYILTGE